MSKFTVIFDADLKLGNEENDAVIEETITAFMDRVYAAIEENIDEARNTYVEETTF